MEPSGEAMADERADDVFAVRARVTPDRARAVFERGTYDFGDHPVITPNPDGTASLDLFVARGQGAELEAAGIAVTFGLNQSARSREQIAELGEGDRFEGGRVVPRGIGRKVGGSGGTGPAEGDSREPGS